MALFSSFLEEPAYILCIATKECGRSHLEHKGEWLTVSFPSQAVPIECEAGTLVLLHGENVHFSAENTSSVSRHSWALHVVEGAAGYDWAADNWAHRKPDFPWEPLYDNSATAEAAAGAAAVDGEASSQSVVDQS